MHISRGVFVYVALHSIIYNSKTIRRLGWREKPVENYIFAGFTQNNIQRDRFHLADFFLFIHLQAL